MKVEHRSNGMFVHQSEYIEKILKILHIDITHLLSKHMVVRTLDPKKDLFQPIENGEKIFGHNISYPNAIGVLLYMD